MILHVGEEVALRIAASVARPGPCAGSVRLVGCAEGGDAVAEDTEPHSLVLAFPDHILGVEVLGDDTKFNSIYVQCCVNQGFNLTEYSLKTKYEKEKVLLDYSNEKPEKFNKLCSDKFISTKALIEMLIARGELSRSELNQNIYTSDGDFIAANIKEAVVYFNNPENKDIRTSYENKLKMF